MKTAREKILTNPALARILNLLFLSIFGVTNQSVKKKATTLTTLKKTVGLKRIKLEIISNIKILAKPLSKQVRAEYSVNLNRRHAGIHSSNADNRLQPLIFKAFINNATST